MRVKGRGPSARALRVALRGTRGLVNWTGAPLEGAINARTETNKLAQLERLRNAGIPTPEFDTSPHESWLGRTSYHAGGMDFLDGTRPQAPDFWTKPVKSTSEYRVHVFRMPGGRTGDPASFAAVRVGWKSRDDSLATAQQSSDVLVPVRSRRFGWKLAYYSTPPAGHTDLILLSRWAVAVLGWDFGAVDVLKTRNGLMVLEANSCPGLKDQFTLDTYVRGIRALSEED